MRSASVVVLVNQWLSSWWGMVLLWHTLDCTVFTAWIKQWKYSLTIPSMCLSAKFTMSSVIQSVEPIIYKPKLLAVDPLLANRQTNALLTTLQRNGCIALIVHIHMPSQPCTACSDPHTIYSECAWWSDWYWSMWIIHDDHYIKNFSGHPWPHSSADQGGCLASQCQIWASQGAPPSPWLEPDLVIDVMSAGSQLVELHAEPGQDVVLMVEPDYDHLLIGDDNEVSRPEGNGHGRHTESWAGRHTDSGGRVIDMHCTVFICSGLFTAIVSHVLESEWALYGGKMAYIHTSDIADGALFVGPAATGSKGVASSKGYNPRGTKVSFLWGAKWNTILRCPIWKFVPTPHVIFVAQQSIDKQLYVMSLQRSVKFETPRRCDLHQQT